MRYQRQAIEKKGSKVPAYIVTFSDMVTLLLTFFVMLLSLASTQEAELFYKGQGAFLRSISNLGLGILFGKKQGPDFGNVKIKYFISRPDKSFESRTINAREEEIRRVFKDVGRSMKTMPSQIVAKRTNFSITNIRFAAGDATLSEPAKKFLTEFCLDLQGPHFAAYSKIRTQQEPGPKAVMLYVLGLSSDAATEKDQWILSARRARAAADFLQDTLSPLKWPVYSWGAGPGGDWVGQDSPISKQSQILIAVLRPSD